MRREFGVDGYGSVAVFTLYERDKLVGAVGVVGLTLAAVHNHVNGLCAYDLRSGGNQRYQTGVAANHGDERHGFVETVLGVEGAQVCHHV